MSAKIIVIDGYIGPYGYSKQFIRNELAGQSKNPVTIKISSLGGSVDDALNIYDQFIEHGNVTAELSAFVASSATLLSLGAKTVRMNENSFYLIHKAMNWVDEWGTMNEDEIQSLIAKLEAQKQQLAKITLQLAKMYVKKTGKTLDQITGLMKQESWLTAEEAKTWGFVDEVFVPEVDINFLDNLQMVSMVTSNGFPEPPRKSAQKAPVSAISETVIPDEDSFFDRIWNRLIKKQKDVNPKNIKVEMKKQFTHLNSALNISELEGTEEGAFLNHAQLEEVEQRLEATQQLVAERDSAILERDTATTNLGTAQQSLASAYDPFNAIDPVIATAATPEAKAAAIRALLAARPAAAPVLALEQQDEIATDEVDWEAINNLEHNKQVDKNS
ncbi:MAG: Clp protease ClpP [Mariniphaga sp.]